MIGMPSCLDNRGKGSLDSSILTVLQEPKKVACGSCLLEFATSRISMAQRSNLVRDPAIAWEKSEVKAQTEAELKRLRRKILFSMYECPCDC